MRSRDKLLDRPGKWIARLGYVVPSWNTIIEYETERLIPDSVSAHFARISHTEDSVASLQGMVTKFGEQAELLRHAQVDAICFACTGSSFLNGRQADVEFVKRATEAHQVPVVSMAGALVGGAEHLRLEKLAVAAPYEQWLLDRLVAYLEEAGFRVVNAVGLGHQANILHPPDAAIDLARRAWRPEADGLILSCGNFRSLEIIETLEDGFCKPVLSSNQSALWALLAALNCTGTVEGGELLRTLGPDLVEATKNI
jgi:maleate isomerase